MHTPDLIPHTLGTICEEKIPADLGHTYLPVGSAQGVGTTYTIWISHDRTAALILCSSGPAEFICWKYARDLTITPAAQPDPYLVAMLWALNETADEITAEDGQGTAEPFNRYALARLGEIDQAQAIAHYQAQAARLTDEWNNAGRLIADLRINAQADRAMIADLRQQARADRDTMSTLEDKAGDHLCEIERQSMQILRLKAAIFDLEHPVSE